MATNLSATLNLVLGATFTNALDNTTTKDALSLDLTDTLANGTGTDQANQIWHDRRTLAATSENLDVAGGLTDPFGATVTFTAIKCILIHNRETTAGYDLTIGGGTNALVNWVADSSDKVVIGPNAVFLLWHPGAGYAVTAGTGDILKIDAGANTVTYDIVLIGTD